MKYTPAQSRLVKDPATVEWKGAVEAIQFLYDWYVLGSETFNKKWERPVDPLEWDEAVGKSAMRLLDRKCHIYKGCLIPDED